MRSIKELKNIRGKRVLVRVDFNVHIEKGRVTDDTRIAAAVPTVEWLLKKGAKVVLMTHFGRPGKEVRRYVGTEVRRYGGTEVRRYAGTEVRRYGGTEVRRHELAPMVEKLSELLKKKVQMIEQWDFREIGERVKKMSVGGMLMLPNLRLHPGEEKNSPAFARELAGLGQIYVNEAFGVDHRAHASLVRVPKLLPAYAGLRLMEEVETLSRVLHKSEKPLVVLMGGGKITDKMVMLKTMVKRADAVLVGGALATAFFKAMGYGVGASKIEPEGVRLAKKLAGNKKIILPKDVVVGTEDGRKAWVVEIKNAKLKMQNERLVVICQKPYAILDIGPKTILEYAGYIKRAKALAWNGPMGRYEVKRFSHGTIALGRLFAARSKGKAFGIIGGGETIDAVRKTGMIDYVDFISTGGGAMLEFLGGKKLPGISALELNS